MAIDICAFTSTGVAIFFGYLLQSARHQNSLIHNSFYLLHETRSVQDLWLRLKLRSQKCSKGAPHWFLHMLAKNKVFECHSLLPGLSGFTREEDRISLVQY